MKKIIGLTGGMLSGKTEVLKIFSKQGAGVLSADEIVAGLLKTAAVQKILLKEFGVCDKESLKKILENPTRRKKLENILHPLARREGAKIIKTMRGLIVFEVPLLFEAGWSKYFDLTLCVISDGKDLSARLKKRGLSKKDFEVRSKAQMPPPQKAALADIVIVNCGSLKDLEVKIKKICKAIKK
ncbi:MAG: dephospho-CoA kinase [Elusimicrobium sp.]|jgi:dephospho-CoA kinase|nr:dephospho-CoA kinase [Elusimicrobium sp.]